jgi:hypothetical protein
VTPELAARLASLNIQLMAEAKEYCIFARETCVAVVQRAEGGFGSVGSTGLLTEKGLAYLVWREGRPLLAAHGSEVPADAAQVEQIRKFSEDLKSALSRDLTG